MHDIEGHAAVVDARDVHAHRPPLRAEDLDREFSRLAQHDHAALAGRQRQPLRLAGGRDALACRPVPIGRRIAQLEERDAPRRPLERLAGERAGVTGSKGNLYYLLLK